MSFFFQDKDYKIPSTSNYMKFVEGANTFRILGSFLEKTAIMGYVYWITDENKNRKPVRVKMGIGIPTENFEEDTRTGELQLPRHFWALPVYNWNEKRIQILEITQKTVLNAILVLSRNKKWGDPKQYDITVSRDDSTGKTAYSVMPEPKEELPKEVTETYKKTYINMNALFDGTDPFRENIYPDTVNG